ncbi:pilus assembly protein TadG-related protein [Pseudarthrobacter sp. S6]|uniref:pilus assembly protein TadG-related protein n=1 Tax=Pseudarthrobacter sp. S6 TaxID=3418420 RepID=UPI003CEF08E3
MSRIRRSGEEGVTAVIVVLMMVVLIGAGAIAVDVGQIYAERGQLQNAADAGALAVADSCAKAPSCDPSLATPLANGNSLDGESTVSSVDTTSVAGQVTVTTTTKNAADHGPWLSKLFASALGNAPAVNVGATATVKLKYPTKGVTVLPLTFAPCEFQDDGLPHLIQVQSGTLKCTGLNPSNQVIPGGFGWLNPDSSTGCVVTAEVGQWSLTSAGGAVPNGCIDLFDPTKNPPLAGSTIALPVYKYTCAGMAGFSCTGSGVEYFIEKWAGFKIEAWNLTGQAKYDPLNKITSGKGIYGTFVGYAADPALFTNESSTPNGTVVVLGLIK